MLKPNEVPDWATDDDYPMDGEPEEGTPTKVSPLSGKRLVGNRPAEFPRSQHHNWLLNKNGEWAEFVQHRLGRTHTFETNWYPDPTIDGFNTSVFATGLAAVGYSDGPDGGPGLNLFVAANADFARGYGPYMFNPPTRPGTIAILEWELETTDLVGVPNLLCLSGLSHDDGDIANADCYLFEKTAVDASWHVRITQSGSTTQDVDTGVAVAAGVTRLAILFLGEDETESLSEEVHFYIDGVLVASFDASNDDMPNADPQPFLTRFQSTGALNKSVKVSPVRFTASRYREP